MRGKHTRLSLGSAAGSFKRKNNPLGGDHQGSHHVKNEYALSTSGTRQLLSCEVLKESHTKCHRPVSVDYLPLAGHRLV